MRILGCFTVMIMMAMGMMGCGQIAQQAAEKAADAVKDKVTDTVADKAAEVAAEKAIEHGIASEGKQADVDIKADGSVAMTVKGEDGSALSMGSAAKIPDDFPKDVPVYANWTLSIVNAVKEQETFSISASTKDALDTVSAYFKKEAGAQGWKEQVTMNQAGDDASQVLMFEKESRMLNIILNKNSEGTDISLTTGKS